jgi:predicted site-specific integrase-resolvase
MGGHRRISVSSINEWMGIESDDSIRKTLIYARVSGRRQKVEGNLTRQVDRLKVYCDDVLGEAKENLLCISEQGSGLSETRTGYPARFAADRAFHCGRQIGRRGV